MSLSQNQNQPTTSRTHCKRVRIPKDAVDFCKIGGLNEHLKTLREMIIIPLLQGNVYSHFNIKAPRGVLFYGPPGTGKTLVAAAIATEINKEGIGKVAFFQRKGADVLDKWVGGSEKNLRDLFEKATKARPSIIFFDEIDGLAPVREKQSDQIHSSVVATLLALMDGLDNKPGLIVIGATNRLEAVDPALRRPGRFDKELYFPLPGKDAREEILKVHIESWKHKPTEKLLTCLAHSTSGFSGADLQALCSEAVLRCMKRAYPTLRGVKVDPEKLRVEECDFLNARAFTIPSSSKDGQIMRKLTPIIQPLLEGQLRTIIRSIQTFWPHFLQENFKRRKIRRQSVADWNQLSRSEHAFGTSSTSNTGILTFICLRYQRKECEQLSIMSSLEDIHAGLPVLVVATCKTDIPYMDFFYNNSSIMLKVENPSEEERKQFLKPLFFDRHIVSVYSVLENTKRTERPMSSGKSEYNVAKPYKKGRNADELRPSICTRSSKRKRESSLGRRSGKRIKNYENEYELTKSNSLASLYDIHKQKRQEEEKDNQPRKCGSDTSLTSIFNQPCFADIFTNLLKQRNSRYRDDNESNSTQSAIKKFLCEKTPRTQSKKELEVKTISEKSNTGDPLKQQVYNLWRHTSLITSRKMSVAQLELLYDVISACINIHWNSFTNLIKNLEEILQNIEKSYMSDH